MFAIVWAALGWLLGLALTPVARRLAGETAGACPGCGELLVAGSGPGLARLLDPQAASCPACGRGGLTALAVLGPGLALVYGLLAMRWPLGLQLVVVSFYGAVLLLVAVLDLRHRLVYPLLTYPATLLAMILTPISLGQPVWSGLVGALAGAAVFYLFHRLAVLMYRSRGALGLGDVMIGGLVGAMVGFPAVGGALMAGILLGGLAAILVGLVLRSRRAHFAYGPTLCLGAMIVLLQGLPM